MNDYSNIDNKFIKDNEGIIKIALNKISWLPDFEDILQEARIWLLEAKCKHNKQRSSWTTFAKYYIQHSYRNYQRRNFIQGKSLERNGYTSFCIDDMNDEDLFNISNTECLDDELEAKCIYDYYIDNIKDEKTRDIIKMRLSGASCRIIAYKYGCTISWISLLYKNEIKRIRKDIKKYNWGKEFFIYTKNTERLIDKIDINKIKQFRKDGLNWHVICKKLRVGYQEIGKFIDKNDYPLRKV
jgi:hypothetical protein